MEDVVILGVGMHPWGKFPEKPWVQMEVEAAKEALDDAGVEWTDVQALISGFVSGGMPRRSAGHVCHGRAEGRQPLPREALFSRW